jgi:hypothetical protein
MSTSPSQSMSPTATANAPSVLVVIMVGVQEVGLPPSLEYQAILLSNELEPSRSKRRGCMPCNQL